MLNNINKKLLTLTKAISSIHRILKIPFIWIFLKEKCQILTEKIILIRIRTARYKNVTILKNMYV